MGSKNSIAEQISNLESENLRLQEYEKSVEKLLKNLYGFSLKDVQIFANHSDFFRNLLATYKLKNQSDFDDFAKVFFTEKSTRFFTENRDKITPTAEQDKA